MKKLIAMILALAMVFALASCGGSQKEAASVQDQSAPASASAEVETDAEEEEEEEGPELTVDAEAHPDNPLYQIPVETERVLSGGGQDIGARAFIRMSAADFAEISDENLAEYVEDVVDGADFNWFTIELDDGNGLQFASCMALLGQYGAIDDTGRVVAMEQNVAVSDGEVKRE